MRFPRASIRSHRPGLFRLSSWQVALHIPYRFQPGGHPAYWGSLVVTGDPGHEGGAWLCSVPARWIGRVVMVVAAVGAAATAGVVVAALARSRPTPGPQAWFAAEPTIAAGQLWAILVTNGQQGFASCLGSRRTELTWLLLRRFFFADLNGRASCPLLGLGLAGWLESVTAASELKSWRAFRRVGSVVRTPWSTTGR